MRYSQLQLGYCTQFIDLTITIKEAAGEWEEKKILGAPTLLFTS